jgi:tetratricopeptide (TPR) repeat protein
MVYRLVYGGKMKLQSSRIMMFILIGVLFLTVSSVYAETAEEYVTRGKINYRQGNYAQAISDFTKAIEINPSYDRIYAFRGRAYLDQGNYIQAISDCTKAIEICPNGGTYYDRGYAYFKIKEYDKAWEDVHRAEALGWDIPKCFDALKKASGRDK